LDGASSTTTPPVSVSVSVSGCFFDFAFRFRDEADEENMRNLLFLVFLPCLQSSVGGGGGGGGAELVVVVAVSSLGVTKAAEIEPAGTSKLIISIG